MSFIPLPDAVEINESVKRVVLWKRNPASDAASAAILFTQSGFTVLPFTELTDAEETGLREIAEAVTPKVNVQ